MYRVAALALAIAIGLLSPALVGAQKYRGADGKLRVALAQQPLSPNACLY